MRCTLVLNNLFLSIFKYVKFHKCSKYVQLINYNSGKNTCFEVKKTNKKQYDKNSIKTKLFNYCVPGNTLIKVNNVLILIYINKNFIRWF